MKLYDRFVSFVLSKLVYRVLARTRIFMLAEPRHLQRLFSHIQVDAVLDVGANCGQYGKMLRRRAGFNGWIFSFEPNPEAFEKLKCVAGGDAKWRVFQSAFGAKNGEAEFNIMSDSQFSSFRDPKHDEVKIFTKMNVVEKRVVVEVETVDSVLQRLKSEHGVSRPFLKLDTQGFDIDILRGAEGSLSEFVGLQSELSFRPIYEGSVGYLEAMQYMKSVGFDVSALVPNNSGHFPRLIELDCIMIRRGL